MKNIKIKDVLKIIEGEIIFGNEDDEIIDVSTDTRKIKEGDTFIAIKGETNNGNLYCNIAFESGARICLVEDIKLTDTEMKKYSSKKLTLVKTKDNRKALIKLATYKRTLYDIPVIAITGSVGKTSTKDAIASVVSQKYKVLKTEGNFNNSIGLPLTILKLKDHEALVVEMGMNHFGEIRELTNIAKPTISVISNIGTSHIGILGSRENILKAKMEILEGMKEDGILIVNNDNDLLNKWNNENSTKTRTRTFGIISNSDVKGYDVEHFENKSKFKIKENNREYTLYTSKPGEPFVMNALSAIAVGIELGISIESAKEGLENTKMTVNRLDCEKIRKDITLIKDYYNASYESIKPGLEYLMSLKEGRKIAVLGDIKELGGFSQELHEKVGKEVYKQKVDILVTVGEDAKYISKEAINMGMNKDKVYTCNNNNEAANVLNNIMERGDKVLLKASNSMKFGEIYNQVKGKRKIGVIIGGMSSEHDVSIKSGKSILDNIDKDKYKIKTIYISKQGETFEYIGENSNIEKLEMCDLKKVSNLMSSIEDCDVIFPVLHGAFGEDGCVQGIFEMMKKPYVGCGVLSSSICMDKVFTKEILKNAGIEQAKYMWIKKTDDKYLYIDDKLNEKEVLIDNLSKIIEDNLNYPMFIKPSNAGSSIGVTKATNSEELISGIKYAVNYDYKIIIEQGIIGREIECAILGNNDVIASCTGEVLAADTFYSYEAKYENKESRTIIPADVDKSIEEEIKRISIKAFKAVDGKGLSRVDFFIEDKTNKIILNEINTLPGFTNISMYPKLFEESGIKYKELIDRLIEMAKVEKFELKNN